jgi:hypothetical protein
MAGYSNCVRHTVAAAEPQVLYSAGGRICVDRGWVIDDGDGGSNGGGSTTIQRYGRWKWSGGAVNNGASAL